MQAPASELDTHGYNYTQHTQADNFYSLLYLIYFKLFFQGKTNHTLKVPISL